MVTLTVTKTHEGERETIICHLRLTKGYKDCFVPFGNQSANGCSAVDIVFAIIHCDARLNPYKRFFNVPSPASLSFIFVYSNKHYNFYDKNM